MGMLALAGGLRSLAAAAGGPGIGPIDYFCYQGVAILRYIWLLMVPLGLTVDPDIRVAPLAAALAWGVISVVILLLPGRTDIRSPGMWLAGGLLLLLPTSSIFPAADLAADRRMYLPMMAFAPLAGLLLARVPRRLLAAFALVFCLMAWSRTRVWQDPQSLWMEAARLAPDKIRPKRQLARLLPPAQAVEMLEDASSKAPEDAALAGDLGSALLQAGRPDQALNVYDRMLALDPHSAAAMTGRGVALAALGQRAAAQGEFERVLQTDPCHFDARINLARLGTDRPAPVGCAFTPGQYQALAQAAISEP
jgi:tetratricopeptide (TPR) repeat protein